MLSVPKGWEHVGSTGEGKPAFLYSVKSVFVENQEAVGSSTVNSAFYTRKKEKAKIKNIQSFQNMLFCYLKQP